MANGQEDEAGLGSDGDHRDLAYLNTPFLSPTDSWRVMKWLLVDPVPPRPKPMPIYVARTPEWDANAAARWEEEGFTVEERDGWIAAGLSRLDVHIASQCSRQGISPTALALVVDGRRIAERLRSGESVGSIAARLRGSA